MAKIGHLEVDTINLAADLVTGAAKASGHNGVATAANPAALPVQVDARGLASFSGSTGSDSASFTLRARRLRGNLVLGEKTFSISGNQTVSRPEGMAILDPAAEPGDEYRVEATSAPTGGFPPPFAVWSSISIAVTWTKL